MNTQSPFVLGLKKVVSRAIVTLGCLSLAAGGLWVYTTYCVEKARPRRLASEGEFYLCSYVAVHTSRGVVGIPAGGKVRRVHAKAGPGLVKVTDGQYAFDVAASQLTDDLDLAESLAASDGETQRQSSERAEADRLLASRAQSVVDQRHANDVAQVNAQFQSDSAVGSLTRLDTGVSLNIGLPYRSVYYYAPVYQTVTTSAPAPSASAAVPPAVSSRAMISSTVGNIEDPLAGLHKGPGAISTMSPQAW